LQQQQPHSEPKVSAQPHPAGNTATGTLEYSELLGIMKQMQERATTQAALAHEQSEKLENRLSELTKKLDEVTQVMEEQQFKLTCSTKVRADRVDSNMKKLEHAAGGEIETDKVDQTRDIQGTTESDSDENPEPTISGEPTTINVTKQIGQEHATLTLFRGSQENNISGENVTTHTNSQKIDTAHETVTQHQAHGSIHNGKNTDKQKSFSVINEELEKRGQKRSMANAN